MKKVCINLSIIILIGLSGYFNPASAGDLRNSAGSYSQYTQGGSAQKQQGRIQRGPGGDAVEFPVGPGFTVLMGLSLCYLSYVVLTKSKKEEK